MSRITSYHSFSKPTRHNSDQYPSVTRLIRHRRHEATLATLGGASFPMVTSDHFIKLERDKHSSGSKRTWVGEPPVTSQLHHQAPRPDVGGVPLNLKRGAKAILPLGIVKRSFQVINFDSNTNKVMQSPNMNILNKKHETVRLRQAAHK